MGHWTGIKHIWKLNNQEASYEEILKDLQDEISAKYAPECDHGEGFSADFSEKNSVVTYKSSGYKNRVSHYLSNKLYKKIENNINSNPKECYGFDVSLNDEDTGAIYNLQGYAITIGEHLSNAGFADYYSKISFYNERGITKFYECINSKEELEQIIKQGEAKRIIKFLRQNKYSQVYESQNFFDLKEKQPKLNELWLAYFLAYGTNNQIKINNKNTTNNSLKLKEFLFLQHKDTYYSTWGKYTLQELMKFGVSFDDGIDSVTEFNCNGQTVTTSEIENWYQENKTTYQEFPLFSKETIELLKENFPDTFIKLKNKLIDLHKTPFGITNMNNQKYWSGEKIETLEANEVFVFGANPEARHFAGAAKAALKFGAIPKNGDTPGIARGLSPNNKTYALITKNLTIGTIENGITYDKEGFQSVSPQQIRDNIDELYSVAKNNPDKRFLITYQYETWPNGTPKKSLNGYTSQEMLEMFAKDKEIPINIVFHESYKKPLEILLSKKTNQKTENINKEYTFFFHLTSPFSNFHPARFEYKDFTFISNEQFMMFSKAKTFGDEETANRIINIFNEFMIEPGVFKNEENKLCFQLASSFKRGEITTDQILKNKEYCEAWNNIHKKIKALGREVKNYDDDIWSEKREKVVFFGAREKFNQNENLKQILLDTKDSYLVEASPYDKIWGIGLSATDAKKIPENKWPGQNLLGKVLTNLKNEFVLKKKKENKVKP